MASDDNTWGLADPEASGNAVAGSMAPQWGLQDPDAPIQVSKPPNLADANMPRPSAPPPGTEGSATRSFLDAMAAGSQGVNPNVNSSYKLAPSEQQWAFAETGKPLDEQHYVALRHPETGQYAVYEKTPDIQESAPASLGRMLMAAVPENFPGAVTAATATAAKPGTALLQDFEKTGVTPNLPAVGQGRTSALVSQVANTLPVVGPTVRSAAGTTMADTMNAAERSAATYGNATGPLDAGEAIQGAVQSFAKGEAPAGMTADQMIAAPTRESSFPAKAGALYDRFQAAIDPTSQVPIGNTLEALKGPLERFPTSPELGSAITNPKLQSYFQTLAPGEKNIPAVYSSVLDAQGNPILMQAAQKMQSGGTLTLGELQELRSTIGRQLGDAGLVTDIPRGDLKTVYAGISRDLENAANATGPEAAHAFNRANQYYSAGIDRIDQLEPLLKGSPEQAFAAVNRAAGNGPAANSGMLTALQRSMPPDQWNNVGAAVIRRLGEPTPGAKDALGDQFSPSTFATNWNKISDPAKNTLFGAETPGSPRETLESLARVAQAQKNVAKLANSSHSGEYTLMGGAAMAAFEHRDALLAHPLMTIAGLMTARGMGQLLMSPGFSRWLYSAPAAMPQAPASMVNAARGISGIDALARAGGTARPDLAEGLAALRAVPAH